MKDILTTTLKSYVITIDSLEESRTSAQRTIDTGREYSFETIQNFSAITPETHFVQEEFKKNKIPEKSFTCISTKRNNVMGCFLSHFYLWLKCVELDEPILILEHDAVFVGGFDNNIIPDFRGLLSIGAPSYGRFLIPNKHGVDILKSKQYLPGAHAYIIKPDAANDIIKHAKHYPRPADVFLNLKTFPWIQEYYPWLVKVEETFSTVQSSEGCTAKHAFVKNPQNYKLLM